MQREAFEALDRIDPLAPLRDKFLLPPGVIYLVGNSLGALPRSTAARVSRVIEREWGEDLITSWNRHDWIAMPQRVGDKIARLIGAEAGEVVVAESTSINLFKVLAAALKMRPGRRVIVSDTENFPTDLYMAEGLAKLLDQDYTLRLVAADDLKQALGADTAVLMLTQVNFRTGAIHDMASQRSAGRFRNRLRLQVPQWWAGRAGLRLRCSTSSRADPAAPVWLVRSRRALRVRCRLPTRAGDPAISLQHPIDTGAGRSGGECRSAVAGGLGAAAGEVAGAHGGVHHAGRSALFRPGFVACDAARSRTPRQPGFIRARARLRGDAGTDRARGRWGFSRARPDSLWLQPALYPACRCLGRGRNPSRRPRDRCLAAT